MTADFAQIVLLEVVTVMEGLSFSETDIVIGLEVTEPIVVHVNDGSGVTVQVTTSPLAIVDELKMLLLLPIFISLSFH